MHALLATTWGSPLRPALCPCPRGHSRLSHLAPGHLQPRVGSTPEHPSDQHGLSGGQAPERHSDCSGSHSKVGQSQAQILHFPVPVLRHCASRALPHIRSHLLFLVGTQRCHGPPWTSWTKGRKGGCSVLGSRRSLQEVPGTLWLGSCRGSRSALPGSYHGWPGAMRPTFTQHGGPGHQVCAQHRDKTRHGTCLPAASSRAGE